MEPNLRSATQVLASVLLGEDVMTFCFRLHDTDGLTWDKVRDALAERTRGKVDITMRTMTTWVRDERALVTA